MMENVADNAIDVMKQTIIFGNIITMDEKRPFARAALVKNGVFAYIGEAEEAKRLAGPGAQVLDYGDNYIGKSEDDYSQVDSVTGATISSKAYKKALGNAFAAYDQLTKEAK